MPYEKELCQIWGKEEISKDSRSRDHRDFRHHLLGSQWLQNRDETCENPGVLWHFSHVPKVFFSHYFLSSSMSSKTLK